MPAAADAALDSTPAASDPPPAGAGDPSADTSADTSADGAAVADAASPDPTDGHDVADVDPVEHRAAVGRALDELSDLGDAVVADGPLGALTTYRVGGTADVVVRPRSLDDLAAVGRALEASSLPVLVLGRGSNLLVADAGYRGIVVSLAEVTDHLRVDAERCVVDVGSAVALPVVARRLAPLGLTGFEWAVGVPGSVGGAVRMNAGGHGSDTAASLIDVTVHDLRDGRRRTVPAADLGLRFRASSLGPHEVVPAARLQLSAGDPERAKAELSEIVAWRRANQPGGQNAGSVFVNPVPGEVSAGALIDGIGLRGARLGTASVSGKHANFIQSDEGGSADDVFSLMALVRERVERETGFALRSEIRLVGFPDGDVRREGGS